MENDQRVLSDFCLGYFVKSNTDPGRGMVSSSLEMAKALDIPSNIDILIGSDSTLRTYVTPKSKDNTLNTKKNKEMIEHIKWVHPYYKIDGRALNGATIRTIYDDLPKAQEAYDKYDCVIIVVNLNQAKAGGANRTASDRGSRSWGIAFPLRRFSRSWAVVGSYSHSPTL